MNLWYYEENGGKHGPYSNADISVLHKARIISDDAMLLPASWVGSVGKAKASGFPGGLLALDDAISWVESQLVQEKDPKRIDVLKVTRGELLAAKDAISTEATSVSAVLESMQAQQTSSTDAVKHGVQSEQHDVSSQPEPTAEEETAKALYNRELSVVCNAFVYLEVQLQYAIKEAYAIGEHSHANALGAILSQVQRDGLAVMAMLRVHPPLAQLLHRAFSKGLSIGEDVPSDQIPAIYATWIRDLNLDEELTEHIGD